MRFLWKWAYLWVTCIVGYVHFAWKFRIINRINVTQANIYLFKLYNKNVEKGVKYVQS